MKLSRRQFLRVSLAAAAPFVLAACGTTPDDATPTPLARPEPPLPATATLGGGAPIIGTPPVTVAGATVTAPAAVTATAQPALTPRVATLAARNPKRSWAWLRMLPVGDIPTSEADYRAHLRQIDAVMPLNGGRLQADGTWDQDENKISGPWPQGLPEAARAAGQLYLPGLSNDLAGTLTVLASASLQERAAADLVRLATEGRFDSPWDGVYLDLEGVSYDHRTAMSGFLFRLARAVKDAGLLLGISVGGVNAEATGTLTGDDAIDLGVVSEIADFVDLRLYDWGGPPPRSIAPYWWMESCLQYALKKGVRPAQMTAGLANFSQFWPDDGAGDSQQITNAAAVALARWSNAAVQWQEGDANGPVRESYALIGKGRLAITDEKSYRHGLGLATQYGLLGSTLFAPGMGSEAQWQVLTNWKAGRPLGS